jgi:flagellar biosynthesis protein FlhF
MKIKKFTAPTMPEAMKLIRKDLGTEAIILNSKEVEKGGFFGFFTKKQLEVVAAVDPDSAESADLPVASAPNVESNKSLQRDIRKLESELSQLKAPSYPGLLAEMREWLGEQEIEAKLADYLMKPLVREWYKRDESLNRSEAYEAFNCLLTSELEKKSAKPFRYEKKYLLLTGPTGVGKTTTLAKIAAKAKLEDGKSIAFITADTYRIAAVDQLKAYADILNVPIEVAYTMEDFHKAKEKFADRDLVLVDTAGRNFKESVYIEELQRLVPFGADTETWLVLSMTSKYRDMLRIVNRFKELNPDRCVFTKWDESSVCGAVVNFWLKNRLVPAYITNGQSVPDDLFEATPAGIARLLTGVEANA